MIVLEIEDKLFQCGKQGLRREYISIYLSEVAYADFKDRIESALSHFSSPTLFKSEYRGVPVYEVKGNTHPNIAIGLR